MSAAGGTAVQLTTGDMPSFLPDGKHFLYRTGGNETSVAYLGSIDGAEPRVLLKGVSQIRLAAGYLLAMELAAVTISTDRGFAFSNPVRVPRGPLAGGDSGAPSGRNYDPARVGRRILGVIDASDEGSTVPQLQVVVVLGWHEELKQRVSTR